MSIVKLLDFSVQVETIPAVLFRFIESILKDRRPIGVFYYGSSLWKQDITGLLDFYIICEDLKDWYGGKIGHYFANELLPPNIEYHEYEEVETTLRAKVAILTLKQFRKATGLYSIDTTMWARFCQPVKIIWSRDEQACHDLFRCLVRAAATACWWAAYLGPKEGKGEAFWCNLFAYTYGAELRVEAKNRPMSILENREDYFIQLLEAGWKGLSISFDQPYKNYFFVNISDRERQKAYKKWQFRQKIGRPLNIVRLIKAAFTFQGGADYVAWKIKRHQGIDLNLSPFQKKRPLMNAPWILLKLYRQGVFKR